jgi:hypothetical protein
MYFHTSILDINPFNFVFTPAAWAIVSYFLAEHASQRRGHMLVWYGVFFVFNIWAYIYFWYTEDRSMQIRAENIRAEKIIEPRSGISSLVSSAVHVYSPTDLNEHYIQELFDQNRFDDAIQLTRNRVAQFKSAGDDESAAKYRSMIDWLDGAKKRYAEDQYRE